MTIIEEPATIQREHSPEEVSHAFSAALSYMATDAFNLTPEESSWVSYNLQDILKTCAHTLPVSLPNAVSHELETKHYSASMSSWKGGVYLPASRENKQADLDGWLDVFSDMITGSYQLTILQSAETRARLRSIFEDLGVGHKVSPRAAFYMPNAVRWITANA